MVLCAVVLAAGFPRKEKVAAEEQIADGWIRLTDRAWAYVAKDDRSANGALLIGDRAALAVDPGLTPELAHRFFAGIAELTDRPLRHVVLTHWHPDHALGLVCLEGELPGGRAEVIAHPETRRRLAEEAASAAQGLGLDGCRLRLPDHQLTDREVVELGGHEVEIFHPGAGHTQGDLVVWSPAESVLITGDLFLHDSSPFMEESDPGDWIRALEDLVDLEPGRVVPGHFAVAGAEDLARFLRYLQAVDGFAAARLAWGLTPEEIATQVPKAGLPLFEDFAQYPQYQATFADNVRVAARERSGPAAGRSDTRGFTVKQILGVGLAPHQISFSADGRRAYVAAAGSDRIAVVDVPEQDDAPLTVSGFHEVSGTPLGVVELPSGDLAVALFRGGALVRVPRSGAPPTARLETGEAPSLLVGPVPGLDGHARYLVSVEGVDRLDVLDAETFELAASYEVGDRPFPPGVTSDGRTAFVPGYDDGTVTVVDLRSHEVVDKVAVGNRPSGGAVLAGNREYAVAVRGEDKVVFLDTASHHIVHEMTKGIGDGPFSVVVSPDGRLAFVNNTASHDVSVIALGEQREDRHVITRLPVGEIPIVMAVDPSGATLWVGCEGSHELWVLGIPKALRGLPTEAPADTLSTDRPPDPAPREAAPDRGAPAAR